MTIEHLVISGGCVWGLYEYGLLTELNKNGFWKIENIRSMYTTSAGSIVGAVLAMKIDFETLDTYLIDRPWNQVWNENCYHLLEAFNACGLFHKQAFYEMFTPLLKSIDLSIDTTMAEFYEWSGIDLHIFITELNVFEQIEISYERYPDWKLIDAIYASCTLPAIFAPIMRENKCYIDGGFFNNYPIKPCFMAVEDPDTILGICIEKNPDEGTPTMITEDSTIIDFTGVLLNKLLKNMIFMNDNTGMIKYETITCTPPTTIEHMQEVATSKEERKLLIDTGIKDAIKYIEKWNT